MSLKGKVAVITGAAKGIGKSIAETMAREDACVCILDFDAHAGKQLQEDLEKENKQALFIKTDVSSYENIRQARQRIIERFGKVDILVVNAGISVKHPVDEIDVEEWDKVVSVNLNGSFYTCKAFYDDFINKTAADEGKIIFITSGSGITGTGGGAHYAASKSGQHGLMRALAKELGPKGVNVNAIAPRVIVTDIFDMLYPTEEAREQLVEQIPIGRMGYPEDIAELALFLSRRQASYIHGQILLLDGGRTY